jgi:hypothetical protein
MTIASGSKVGSSSWKLILLLTLGFWLSSILMLDGIVMPSLFTSGMMSEPGFAIAGYSLFSLFNRIELLCAGLVFTSVLALRYGHHPWNRPGILTILLSALLLAIALLDTYGFTPQMSALGAQLNGFNPSSRPGAAMNQLHLVYWLCDIAKIATAGLLIWLYNRKSSPITMMK